MDGVGPVSCAGSQLLGLPTKAHGLPGVFCALPAYVNGLINNRK